MFFVPLPHSNPPPQTQTSLELEGKQARTPHFHGGEEVQYDIYIYTGMRFKLNILILIKIFHMSTFICHKPQKSFDGYDLPVAWSGLENQHCQQWCQIQIKRIQAINTKYLTSMYYMDVMRDGKAHLFLWSIVKWCMSPRSTRLPPAGKQDTECWSNDPSEKILYDHSYTLW